MNPKKELLWGPWVERETLPRRGQRLALRLFLSLFHEAWKISAERSACQGVKESNIPDLAFEWETDQELDAYLT